MRILLIFSSGLPPATSIGKINGSSLLTPEMDKQPKARLLPPGGLTSDLNDDDDLLDAWSAELGRRLDEKIAGLGSGDVQLFNPLTHPRDDLQPRPVLWLTMPAFLANARKRPAALAEGDLPANEKTRRQQIEYSEWFTHHDDAGRVIAVDVTTELPEYWTFLSEKVPDKVVELYKTYVSADARREDLFEDNVYNPLNRFNSNLGAMHLTMSINTLNDALGVTAGATRWLRTGDEIIDGQFCNGFTTLDAHADPALYTNINRLAREQRAITFQNPVGVYILGLDLDGWLRPDGRPVTRDDVVARTRGVPPVRMRIEGRGFPLWQSTIGGEPIAFGTQIAERLTVGVIYAVGPAETRHPDSQECVAAEADGRRPA